MLQYTLAHQYMEILKMARTIELKDIIMTAFNNFEANKLCAEIVLKDDYHTVKNKQSV